jgi:hypothetical protein
MLYFFIHNFYLKGSLMADNEERNLKILKTVVITMGIVLILGTIALFIAVLHRSNNPGKEVYNNVAAKEIATCQQVGTNKLTIEVSGSIVSATTNNNILTVVTTDAILLNLGRQQVLMFDVCTGERVGKLEVIGGR